MTRPVGVILLLILTVAAGGTSATQHDESPAVVERWFAHLRAIGLWLKATTADWFSPAAVSAKQGTHIIPDGLNGPNTSAEEDSDGEEPTEHRHRHR